MLVSRFPAHLRLIGSGTFNEGEVLPAAADLGDCDTDRVTGLATRGALLERLEAMGRLAPCAPLSFLVVKVDGLTPDRSADELRTIAGRALELTRGTDMVGRLTGTTFGIALQGTGVTAAGAVAARMTHHLSRIEGLRPSICITVSAATGTGVNAEALPVAAMDMYEPCCG